MEVFGGGRWVAGAAHLLRDTDVKLKLAGDVVLELVDELWEGVHSVNTPLCDKVGWPQAHPELLPVALLYADQSTIAAERLRMLYLVCRQLTAWLHSQETSGTVASVSLGILSSISGAEGKHSGERNKVDLAWWWWSQSLEDEHIFLAKLRQLSASWISGSSNALQSAKSDVRRDVKSGAMIGAIFARNVKREAPSAIDTLPGQAQHGCWSNIFMRASMGVPPRLFGLV